MTARSPLIHQPSDIIREALNDLRLTESYDSSNWPCFTEHHPDSPDNLVCVYDTAGVIQEPTNMGGNYGDKFGIQIKVRGRPKTDGWSKAHEIVSTLDPLSRVLVGLEGHTYLIHCFHRTGQLISLGKESNENFRFLFTINYLVPITLEV